MWTLSVTYLLPLVFVFDTANSCPIANCHSYYDGCNWCGCSNIESDPSACTSKFCDTNTAEYCLNCDNNMIWLTTNFTKSKCGCPQGEQVSNNDCVISNNQCPDASEQLLRCNFPQDNGQCSYKYKICQSDNICGEGFHCNKVDENIFYDECTPIMCQLNTDCNPYDCVDDCVGIGWGTCVKDEPAVPAAAAETETGAKEYCDIDYCLSYYDGCNWCQCGVDSGLAGCSLRMCFTTTAEYCQLCDDNMVWLATDEQTSECGCPQGEEISDDGCVVSGDCPDISEQKLRCNFPADNGECVYKYQICQSDDNCDDGYRCEIRDESIFYDECTPIMCQLDSECNPYDCVDDCVGIGWGTCVVDNEETFCDNIPFCRSYNEGCDVESALNECTMDVCMNSIKSNLCVSTNDCNDGYECKKMNFTNIIEPDLCVSINCGDRTEMCDRYSCLDMCIDDNNDSGKCIKILHIPINNISDNIGDNLGDNDDCTCDDNDNGTSYCCTNKTYDSACLAECDGIINVDEECSEGECVTTDTANNIDLLGLGNKNKKLYWNLNNQHNYVIVGIQLIILSLCCLSVGLAMSFCSFSYKKQFNDVEETDDVSMNELSEL